MLRIVPSHFLSSLSQLGELKRPSRSIPTGSIAALLFVFLVYVTEILLIAGTTSRWVSFFHSHSFSSRPFLLCRDVLLNYYLFLPDINVWYPFVVIGIIAAVFSACLSGLVGASRILKALSVDEIFGRISSLLDCQAQGKGSFRATATLDTNRNDATKKSDDCCFFHLLFGRSKFNGWEIDWPTNWFWFS